MSGNKGKDRLISFFDAILAVGITFMATQMMVPVKAYLDTQDLLSLFEQITVYMISFEAIGGLWIAHSNYFSAHELWADGFNVFLHFILMFFVTLFPFVTLILQKYDQSSVKIIFLVIYSVMECILLLIILLSQQEEKKAERGQTALIRQLLSNRPKEDGQGEKDVAEERGRGEKTEGVHATKGRAMRDIEKLVSTFSGREDIWMRYLMGTSAGDVDDELKSFIIVQQREKKVKMTFSVYSMVVMSAVIYVSVILLMVHPFYCYIPMGEGIAATAVGYIVISKKMMGGENADVQEKV